MAHLSGVKHHYFQVTLFCLYIILATAIMVYHGIGVTPDRYIIILLVGSLFVHRFHRFIHDFIPFIFAIIGYDFLRGFADDLNKNIDYLGPIRVTQWLFNGHIPTIDLQARFYTHGILHWYDYSAALLYTLHFAAPLAFAFFLWFYNRKHFLEFTVGLTTLSYAAFLTYLVYPTAPPWLASKYHLIPHVTKIFNVVMNHFPDVFNLPTVYSYVGENLVAAIPSMHAAYTFLIYLYALRYFKWKGLLVLPYVLAMWLTIIYLGEHYLIDIVIGAIYGLIFFSLSIEIVRHHLKIHNFLVRIYSRVFRKATQVAQA